MMVAVLEVGAMQGRVEETERANLAGRRAIAEALRAAGGGAAAAATAARAAKAVAAELSRERGRLLRLDRESALLRLMTPLLKLYTAKTTVQLCSEAIEAFGAAG